MSGPGDQGSPDPQTEGMGVSSERVGPTGPDQVGTDGTRDVSELDRDAEDVAPEDVPPEQASGSVETNPEGIEPKAGYSSTDPRSD